MSEADKGIVAAKKPKRQELAGKQFGKLTVLEYDTEKQKWKCLCACGNITYKNTGHLNAGAVSCGCIQKQQDFTGKRVGKLTVLEYDPEQKKWKCQCDCGSMAYKAARHLSNGAAVSCGCNWRQPAVERGKKYGRLRAVSPTNQRLGRLVVWECLCDCGNKVFVRSSSLASGHTTSCGCVKREVGKQKFEAKLTYTNDTCIQFAKGISKPRSNTSLDTGVRGVVLKDGKYLAHIKFRKKYYYLGRFSRLEDAVEARRRAEIKVEEYVEYILAGNDSPIFKIDL